MSVPVHVGISHCNFCTGFAGGVCVAIVVHSVTLLATALMDVVGFVVELASSKRICSICLDMVSVILA